MKELYFTFENLDKKSSELLDNLSSFRKRHNIDFLPERSALLVLDMQKYFLDEKSHAFIPSASAIIPGIKTLMDAFLRNNLLVILTRHISTKNDQGTMNLWWNDLIREKDNLSEIIPELNNSDATIINKHQYDAFYQTSLEGLLKERKVKHLVITGVMTHLCCETTARSAFIRDFIVFFPVDGTATYNESFHKSSLINLSHGFSIPVLCKELIETLEGSE